MSSIVISILALLIGSFLNVCIYRIPKEESIALPSSHCMKCGTPLKPLDLIPVLSYLFLRGKCRYCGEKVSILYPVVELLNAALYIVLYFNFGLSTEFFAYCILSSALLVITVIDFQHQIIPEGLIYFLIITGLGVSLYRNGLDELLNHGLGFMLGGGLFLFIAILGSLLAGATAMGGGDIKLMAALGLWFGWKYVLLITLLSFVVGAVVSGILLLTRIKGRKDYIPFGPFICMAAFICILYGAKILQFYFDYLL